MLKVAWLWLRVHVFADKEHMLLARKALLVSCLVLFLACFFSQILLDAHYLENNPRSPRPDEGRIYPQYIKVSYGATVYLTNDEKLLRDMLMPTAIAFFAAGAFLNARWKLLAPYKKSKSEMPVTTKRKDRKVE